MTRRSYNFDSQYHRCCFQITYFLIFSVILLDYFSYGIRQPRSGTCDGTEWPMHCGYNTNICIVSNLTCDGFFDCSDGSDESKATCAKGLACDENPKPVCLHGGKCRSVIPSATRLAHHECDCIAPFTGVNCSEISTTISSPTTDRTDSALTSSTSTVVGQTPTILTSKFDSTTQGITSQTSKITPAKSTLLQTEYTTLSNINSSPVTNTPTLPHKPPSDESTSSIISQSSSITAKSSQTTTASTIVSVNTEGKTILPVHPPPPKQTTRPAKNIYVTKTTKTSPKPQNPSNSSPGFRTTVILVVVLALIFLIPVAIFIHCRMKRRPTHANLAQRTKKDDEEILTQNNKTDLNNKTQELTKPKPNHQRNVSISSIKMKENSYLLGNEMPLDVNMNRPQPAPPPAIRVTYAPDVTNDPPSGSSSSYSNTDMEQQYPETRMWMPGDGSEEAPYFVTGNGPLPVSLV